MNITRDSYYELEMQAEYDEYKYGDTDFHLPIFVPDTFEEYAYLVYVGALECWQDIQAHKYAGEGLKEDLGMCNNWYDYSEQQEQQEEYDAWKDEDNWTIDPDDLPINDKWPEEWS